MKNVLGRRPHRRELVFGLVSQAGSSGTNLGLSVVAGLVAGPDGLGTIYIGFSAYLLALGFQRALFTEPLVTASAALPGRARRQATASAVTVALAFQLSVTGALLAAGLLIGGDVGHGCLLFTPWLVPSLLQDLWRSVLFRDGEGSRAAVNDGVWLGVMLAAVPAAFWLSSSWAVVGAWGAGSVVSAVLGVFQTGARPGAWTSAVRWWRGSAWPLGRWLGLEGIVYTAGAQGLVFVLAAILSTEELGGLRAVQSLLTPLSLFGPALALPALPEMTRRVSSGAGAWRFAVRIGAIAGALSAAYVVVAWLGRTALLTHVFGESFGGFGSLVVAVGVGQVAVATAAGFGVLMKAERRGTPLVVARAVGSAVTLALGAGLATSGGVRGAAWGLSAGAVTGAIMVTMLSLPPADRARRPQRVFRALTLLAFRAIPASVYRRARRVPLVRRPAARMLDLVLPASTFATTRMSGGPLRGAVLELDAREHKEMVVGRYEPHVLAAIESLVVPGSRCFDVGAHLGYFTLVMARLAGPEGSVVAYEPDRTVAERLRGNLSRNARGIARVDVVAEAVGARAGEETFAQGGDTSTGHLSAEGDYTVRVTTLDDAAAAYGVPDVAKVDIEGAERALLDGAAAVLAEGRTSFLIELHSADLERECTQVLEQHGYECSLLSPSAQSERHLLARGPRAR